MAPRASIVAVLLAALALVAATSGSGATATVCPASDPGQLVSQRSGASTAMVPAGTTSVLVCQFNTIGYPVGSARNALIGAGRATDALAVSQLAAGLDALTEGPDYPIACPDDAGDAYVAYFSYPSGVDDPVRIQLGGCDVTTNGSVTRLGIASPVVGQITALAHATPQTGPTGSTGSTTRPTPLPLGPGPVVISVIAGRLLLCGGPAPGGCRVESFTSCEAGHGCTRLDRARIVRDGFAVDSVRLRRGRFSVVVSPGRYTVQLLGVGPHGHRTVVQSKTIVTRRYATTHVTFTIAVP